MNPTLELHLQQCNVTRLDIAVKEALRKVDQASNEEETQQLEIVFKGADGQDFLGAGLSEIHPVVVAGNAGKYAFCGMEECECVLEGNAGDYLGHSLASGLLICKGSVANSAGAMASGGLVAVYGSAGERTAVSLRGADVLIRGNVGPHAGLGMRQGNLIIGGSAGEGLGTGMRGGTIFLRGDAPNISPDIEEFRLREPDRLKLGLLLLKAGIKATVGREFRVFRPTVEQD